MTDSNRQSVIEKIKSSISDFGYHIRIVDGGPSPRYAYTIGLYPKLGFEIVFAGGAYFTLDQTRSVVNQLAKLLCLGDEDQEKSQTVDEIGIFSLRQTDESWGQKMLLGALDYFDIDRIKALQIVPGSEYWTIDVPDMRKIWNPASHPIWQWLGVDWDFPVSSKSGAITDLDALRGHRVTEVMRWEETQWEMFASAGPDVEKENVRLVSLGTLIGYDESLKPVIDLKINSGLWRDEEVGEWHPWGKTEE